MRSMFGLLGLVLLTGHVGSATAQDSVVPEGTQFVFHLDMAAFRETQIGQQLIDVATQAAINEIGEDEQALDQVREALGFDPLTELRSVTVFGTDYERPENNLRAIVRMGATTGNLEGMMLALPEYTSETVGDRVYHAFSPDPGMTVHVTIHTAADGNKSLVVATQRAAVDSLLATLDENGQSAGVRSEGGMFLSVTVLKLPVDILDDDGPPANIAKLIRTVSLTVGERDGHFDINLQLGVEDEQRAEQIRQMAQGAAAMVAFVQDDDEDLQRVQQLLQGLTVERTGTDVGLHLSVPSEQVIEFLREEADLPL